MTAPSNQLSAFSYQLSAIGDEPSCRLVVVAGGAVADVELIADNAREHWVRSVQQQAVGDRVVPDVGREVGRPPAVPAGSVLVFGCDAVVHGLLGLLWNVPGRQRGAFAEEKIFHVLGDELLRLFLPRHQTVLVEDHLHAILPELPRLGGDVLVDALTEGTGPRWRVEAGQLLLKLLAEDLAPALVADGRVRRRRMPAGISHARDCTALPTT